MKNKEIYWDKEIFQPLSVPEEFSSGFEMILIGSFI